MNPSALLLASLSALALAGCETLGASSKTESLDVKPIVRSSSPASLERADAARAAENFAEAIAGYRSVLSDEPDNSPARFGLAESLRQTGSGNEAIGEYLKLVSDEQWRIGSLEGLGYSYLSTGDQANADDSFAIALEENSGAWRAALGRAQIADLRRDWAAADAAYEQALASASERALVLNNYGVSKLARGEGRAAENLFRRALELEPTYERARINLDLAQAVVEPGGGDAAEEANPKLRAQRLNNRGYVALLQQRFDEAEALFLEAIEAHPAFYAAAYENLQMLKNLRAKR